jgi:hypothetical protein
MPHAGNCEAESTLTYLSLCMAKGIEKTVSFW